MSKKGCSTKSDYLDWDKMLILTQRLERDNDFMFSLLLLTGCFTGLRISDVLTLNWNDLLNKDTISLNEKKTGKHRKIKISQYLKEAATRLFKNANVESPYNKIFINRYGEVMSIQYINRKFKAICINYRIGSLKFSTHTMRKTFGRRIWQNSNYSEKSITMLSEIFNHSSNKVTKIYLGIREEEINEVYALL